MAKGPLMEGTVWRLGWSSESSNVWLSWKGAYGALSVHLGLLEAHSGALSRPGRGNSSLILIAGEWGEAGLRSPLPTLRLEPSSQGSVSPIVFPGQGHVPYQPHPTSEPQQTTPTQEGLPWLPPLPDPCFPSIQSKSRVKFWTILTI